jgi:SAM-dependent methyltransferase
MTHIFVYQMGKCASTAIVEALRSAGLEAAHAHELGPTTLAKRVRMLTMQPVTEYVLDHGIGQLVQNIRFTNEIHHRRATGDRVQIITVARHPIDWYWSFLLQTFDAQKHDLLDSDLITTFEDARDRGAERDLSALHQVIVDACALKISHGMRLAADALATATGHSPADRVANARRAVSNDDHRTAGFGFDLLHPLEWFGEHLEPLTKMTVFAQPLSADGSCRMANEWCDLLVLSYERLATLDHVIAGFVGRPVTLPLANPSRGKPYGAEVAAIRQLVSVPEVLANHIWTSPYCRHFGYSPSPHCAAVAPDALNLGISSRDAEAAPARLGDWLTILRCPLCRSPNLVAAEAAVQCLSCRATYPVSQGIVDFVAGRASTLLDDLDYDALYMISDEPSPIMHGVQAHAAGRWPASLGDTLEVGAGTGGQTVPLIMAGNVRSLVVTDLSAKMLRLCRERLTRTGLDKSRPLAFVTYGSAESPFRDASFDSCFGSSVMHHILDVGAFLADIVRVLRPHGLAFFIEPNARFHQALLNTLADILMDLGREDSSNPDIPLMANWLAEINLNLSHMGDLDFLASREDKHLFLSEEIESLARSSGFPNAEALLLGTDPDGCQTLETYLSQSGVSPQTRERVLARARQLGPRYFSLLQPRDLSPSYLLWFSKATPPPRPATPCKTPTAPHSLANNRILYCIELHREGHICNVQGWAVGHGAPVWLELVVDGNRIRTPIWLPSPDVSRAFGWGSSRLFANALCARLATAIPTSSTNTTVMATILTADGKRVDLTSSGAIQLKYGVHVLTNASAPNG